MAQQQADFLNQRHHAEHLPTTFLPLFEQGIETPFGQHRLVLHRLQQGLLQLDVQGHLRVEFGGRRGLFAVIGLAQACQPGAGQVGTTLGQPQFTFDQGQHGQVVDRWHVPDVHQPLGLGQFGERLGKLAPAAFQPGDHTVADQHADVAAGPCFRQAGVQAGEPEFGLQAQDQQETFVQGQARAHRIQPLRRQALQALLALADFVQGAKNFPSRLQHPGAVVMGQRFKQRIADPLRQLQGFAVQLPGTPQVGVGNGQVGQGRQAHQPLAIALVRQALQGLGAVQQGQVALATATGDDPAQGQPLSQHGFLCGGRRGRQEPAEVAGQFLRGVQLAGQAQGPAVQHDQARGADQQAVGQVHFPAQQHADVLFGQQLFFGQVLHQVRRHVQVTGPQGLLHGFVEQALGIEPAARPQVQAGDGHHGVNGRATAQQVGKQMVVAEPVPLLVERHQEHLVGQQVTQDLGTVVGFAHRVAQFAAKALLGRGVVEKGLDLGGQAIDDFFEQVVADQAFTAVQGRWQCRAIASFRGREQPEAQPRHPTFATLDQAFQRLAPQ